MNFRYIFVSGGVISGIGKGVTAASVGFLLESAGYKVVPVKCDAYVNVDAGTIRPQEHGEVFVTEDGIETDQDLGHYERFLHLNLTRDSYVTTGQIYQHIIEQERNFYYQGEDVEVVPHVPEEIIRRINQAGKRHKADFIIVEIGGTVGEYQNVLFLEANRILKFREKAPVVHVHVAYLPTPKHLGEMKSKPVQTSVRLLNESMIQPDFIVGRAIKPLDNPRIERLSQFCNIDRENIISSPYVNSIYEIPVIYKKQNFDRKILAKFGLKNKTHKNISHIYSFTKWDHNIRKIKKIKKRVKVMIVGKYQKTGDYLLPDAYVCVLESIRHAGWNQNCEPDIAWLNAESIEKNPRLLNDLKNIDGLIIPQGWGKRGVEGKIMAIQYVREQKIPYLGLCFGMQLALVEYARHVLKLKDANSQEVDPSSHHLVVHLMPNQTEYLAKKQFGGTIRLGAWPCTLTSETELAQIYLESEFTQYLMSNEKPLIVNERHRHRYEFNLKYLNQYQQSGLIISGYSPDKKLVEAIELPKSTHPYFIGVQFHPEYKSRILTPHPIFISFIKSCLNQQTKKRSSQTGVVK